jgi:hypothetical protein
LCRNIKAGKTEAVEIRVAQGLLDRRVSGHAPEPGRRAGGNRRVELRHATAPQFLEAVGVDPYLNVITVQTTLLSDEQTEVMSRMSEMTAAVQLIQALGGGWDATQLPSADDISTEKVAHQLQSS